MNGFFDDLEDITVNPGYLKGWSFFKMTAVALGPKKPFKNSCSRQLRIVNAVVMYQSNGSLNIPPPGIPRAFDVFSCPGGREFDKLSLPRGGAFDHYS